MISQSIRSELNVSPHVTCPSTFCAGPCVFRLRLLPLCSSGTLTASARQAERHHQHHSRTPPSTSPIENIPNATRRKRVTLESEPCAPPSLRAAPLSVFSVLRPPTPTTSAGREVTGYLDGLLCDFTACCAWRDRDRRLGLRRSARAIGRRKW